MIMSDLSASVLKPNKKTLSLPANAHQRSVTIVYKDEVRFLRQQNSEQQHVFVWCSNFFYSMYRKMCIHMKVEWQKQLRYFVMFSVP